MNGLRVRRKHLEVAAGVAAAVAALAPPGVDAQDIRVEVTGSNIRRVEGEGALPVQVITREEIDRTGSQSAMDILNYISANNSGGAVSLANTIGTLTFSTQTASLRGLGGQNTLVLINGKRITQASGETQGTYGVNIDAIPFSAIERVEVLRDGASAIYGSDAVGGVINFIMRQDFKGIEATAYYGAPTRGGGGEIGSATLTAGWGDLAKDRFNVFGSLYWKKENALNGNRRDFSDSSLNVDEGLVAVSGNTFPAHITTGGIGSILYPNCSPSIAVPADVGLAAADRCFYDPAAAPGVNIIPEVETTSFYGSARWQINPNWQAYLNGAYSHVENNFVIQPTPLSDQILYGVNGDIPATFLLPPTSPYYPHAQAIAAGVDGQPLNLRYRTYALGLRDTTDKNDQYQVLTGVKGSQWDWDMDFSFAYSHSKTTQRTNNGFAEYSRLLPLLSSGVVNPFGESTPAVQAQLDALQYRREAFSGESSGWQVELKGSRDLYKLPAGPLAMAIGTQIGRQTLEQDFSPELQLGDVTGYGGNLIPIDASRRYWSAFAEFNIPIVRTLEGTAAVRYDHYSDFGDTTNPKFALRWNPIRQVLLRGSWGTGFVAPTLTQAYGANFSGLTQAGLEDPLRCPVTQDTNDCITQFTVRFGGNPNLQPQKSTQWQVGFVLEPTPGVSFGVDYFDIILKNLFSNGPTPETILADQATYGYLIQRGPVQPQFPNIPGPILNIDQRFINLGEVRIQGFDIDARAQTPRFNWGRLAFALNGSYYSKYDVQQPDGSFAGFVSNAFQAAVSGITPRYKQYATLTWDYGPWTTTLGHNYTASYIDVGTDINDNLRRVGSQSLWDLYGSYTGFKNWKLTLGVKNLFDTNPPFTNQQTTFQVGFDPTQYDARARFVYGSVTYTFR
jgi:iron complex outermembrane receptor protein